MQDPDRLGTSLPIVGGRPPISSVPLTFDTLPGAPPTPMPDGYRKLLDDIRGFTGQQAAPTPAAPTPAVPAAVAPAPAPVAPAPIAPAGYYLYQGETNSLELTYLMLVWAGIYRQK